jgi:hypothetical protein
MFLLLSSKGVLVSVVAHTDDGSDNTAKIEKKTKIEFTASAVFIRAHDQNTYKFHI